MYQYLLPIGLWRARAAIAYYAGFLCPSKGENLTQVRPHQCPFCKQRTRAVPKKKMSYSLLNLSHKVRCANNLMVAGETGPLSLSLLISLSLGETLLLEPFDGKVYDLLPVFLPELWSCPSNHLCLAPIFWLVFLSLSFRLS